MILQKVKKLKKQKLPEILIYRINSDLFIEKENFAKVNKNIPK